MIHRFLRLLRTIIASFSSPDWEQREAARIEGWQTFADIELNRQIPQSNW
jgi:hypothetical protein